MAYVVVLLLYATPLALVTVVVDRIAKPSSATTRIWICIAVVACIETVFQLLTTNAEIELMVFVATQLYLFGLGELFLFRRFDFFAMFVFRLIYYGYWHVAWGYLRLQWLF